MRNALLMSAVLTCAAAIAIGASTGSGAPPGQLLEGKRLFEQATFGGNGRTCETCHSLATGTVSPADAEKRFAQDPNDPLFVHDGSDDGQGHGTSRMRRDATVLMTIRMADNIQLADDPSAKTVVIPRGIPTTLNTPALDEVLMVDGRQPTLEQQATGAIQDHAQGAVPPIAALQAIAAFQKTNAFFSSPEIRRFALEKGADPVLPQGVTESEIRGRRFFDDLPPDPTDGLKPGLCAHCHSGPLLNQTNEFAKMFIPSPAPIPAGQRFISVGISELHPAGSREFIFNPGKSDEFHLVSPDPGRALITGVIPANDPTLEHVNAFKISPLRGISRTAPYFHDNSAKTLEDVAAHYTLFFQIVSAGFINLTAQDQADIVAYMKLLN
ncbi:MAG TPA: cytochrome c peroxidase [Vicinamibacterales bacterium]|jgi:cytochrome c peroxidase|nr:cytochrome c peroxidase [Vicinamibacterales bacterium]